MAKHLMNDFKAVTAKEWRQKIQVDLKGVDYESLITHTLEGIDIKPFYHQEDTTNNISVATPNQWHITERLTVKDLESTIEQISYSLSKGTEAIWLIIESESTNLVELLKSIDIKKTPIYIVSIS